MSYLLHILRPVGRVTKSHEHTVGQNSAHNDHAKHCRKQAGRKQSLPGEKGHNPTLAQSLAVCEEPSQMRPHLLVTTIM